MSGWKFWAIAVAAAVVLVLVIVGLRQWAHAEQRDRCAEVGAEVVRTGQGRFLCVSSDGRVVGP